MDDGRRPARGRLLRTELSEHLRGELRETPVEPVDATGDPDLRSALERLPGKDRGHLLLVAWEGLGVAEAGAALGLSPAASRKRYSRVRDRLRTELG